MRNARCLLVGATVSLGAEFHALDAQFRARPRDETVDFGGKIPFGPGTAGNRSVFADGFAGVADGFIAVLDAVPRIQRVVQSDRDGARDRGLSDRVFVGAERGRENRGERGSGPAVASVAGNRGELPALRDRGVSGGSARQRGDAAVHAERAELAARAAGSGDRVLPRAGERRGQQPRAVPRKADALLGHVLSAAEGGQRGNRGNDDALAAVRCAGGSEGPHGDRAAIPRALRGPLAAAGNTIWNTTW